MPSSRCQEIYYKAIQDKRAIKLDQLTGGRMKGIESVRGYQEEIIEAIPSTIIVVNRSLGAYANKNYYAKSVAKRERDVLGERLSRSNSAMLIEKTGIIDKIQRGVPHLGSFDGDQIRYPGGLFYFYKIYRLKEDEESISKVVIPMENITELTWLEEELQSYVELENAFAELKENDAIKSELSTAYHELRIPITMINSMLRCSRGECWANLTVLSGKRSRS